MPAAPVFSAELSAKQRELGAPASVDLLGRFSWGICRGTGPRVALEARGSGREFEPATGVAVYRRGTAFTCTPTLNTTGPVAACSVAWGTEDIAFVTTPAETTEYRLRVGPLVSETVTITVASPRPEEHCRQAAINMGKPLLTVAPERARIVFGESVRIRGTFAVELCGRLLHPDSRPGIESLRSGDRFPYQPAQHVLAGPARERDGALVYEVAPPETTAYRLFYLGDFGVFTTIEVAPKLELTMRRTRAGRVSVRVQAYASGSLAGAQVEFERRSGSGWKYLQTATLDPDLTAVARIPVGGSIAIRASVRATQHYAPAVSPTLFVRAAP